MRTRSDRHRDRNKGTFMGLMEGKHLPWLLGLAAAPVLTGATTPETQAIVGLLFAAGLIATAFEATPRIDWKPLTITLGVIAFWSMTLVPLPEPWIEAISPARWRLALEFPPTQDTLVESAPLTTSPGRTVQRLWELTLVAAAFVLARRLAQSESRLTWLILSLALGSFIGGLADIALRTQGRTSLLGIWTLQQGDAAAGGFANRNHFANWNSIAFLMVLGWCSRQLAPLRGCRVTPRRQSAPMPLSAILIPFSLAGFGLLMSILSGSRGGILVLGVGLMLFSGMLWKRSHSRVRRDRIALAMIAITVFGMAFGGYAFTRFARLKADFQDRYPKTEIWRGTLNTASQFPWTGSGLGSFYLVFNHYKDFGGNSAILHAENDYAQSLLETGWPVTLLLAAAAAAFLFHHGRRCLTQPLREPEMAMAAVASLTAFCLHASFEFVFQNPATLTLAAAVTGLLAGLSIRPHHPDQPTLNGLGASVGRLGLVTRFGVGIAFGAIAMLQWTAFQPWTAHRQNRAELEDWTTRDTLIASWNRWPFGEIQRLILLIDVERRLLPGLAAEEANQRVDRMLSLLDHGIRLHPLDWRLRFQRMSLLLGPAQRTSEGVAEAALLCRLYPTSQKLLATVVRLLHDLEYPSQAAELLRSFPVHRATDRRGLFDLAWSLELEPSMLWQLTPNTPEALIQLGDFALSKSLTSMARDAYTMARRSTNSYPLALKLLDSRAPALALESLDALSIELGSNGQLARALALHELRRYPEAIAQCESIWAAKGFRPRTSSGDGTPSVAAERFAAWRQEPLDVALALNAARAISALDPSEEHANNLQSLQRAFPTHPELSWQRYHLLSRLQPSEAASNAAIQTTQNLLRLER